MPLLPTDPKEIKLISRKEAQRLGSKQYFTGEPCQKGHIDYRNTKNRRCMECSRIQDRKRYLRDPQHEKDRSLKSGWKQKGYPEPTRLRPDTCEMCGGPATARRLHLDHNHKTKKFRGWLCHYCNTNLGRLGDDVEGLQKAMAYLMKTESEEALFPIDGKARKEFPISSGLLDYFPNALAEVSRVSLDGNRQHGLGFPLRWDRSKSSDDEDAMLRHFMERGEIDERGMRATARMAWRALAILQKELDTL